MNLSSSLRCKKFGCDAELNRTGNVSYGLPRWADSFKKWGLVGFALLMMLNLIGGIFLGMLNVEWNGIWIAPSHFVFVFGIIIIYGIAHLAPKTTKVTCHKCGHVTETIGLQYFELSGLNFSEAPSTTISANKVEDHSLIDLEKVEEYHKTKAQEPEKKKTKRRRQGKKYIGVSHKHQFPGHRKIC